MLVTYLPLAPGSRVLFLSEHPSDSHAALRHLCSLISLQKNKTKKPQAGFPCGSDSKESPCSEGETQVLSGFRVSSWRKAKDLSLNTGISEV